MSRSLLSNDYSDGYESGYKKGLDDLHKVFKKIYLPSSYGGLTASEIKDVFGDMREYDAIDSLSPEEIIERFKVWEENKKKPVRGDYVSYESFGAPHTGILLYENAERYWVLVDDIECPQDLPKSMYKLTKLDKHVDLNKLFKE